MKTFRIIALFIVGMAISGAAHAQLDPFSSVYFQNQYLANPAFAGIKKGLDLNLGMRKQWSGVPGSPIAQTFTATYAPGEKVGLGLNVFNEKSGLFKSTRVVGSYSYGLPVGEADVLRFGLSLGFQNQRISNEDVNGDAGDGNVAGYNDRQTYVDGDFGAAFIGKKLSIQAAIPNMKSFFKKDQLANTVDRATFFSALSYKMPFSATFGVEPKVVYRGIKGLDNIFDAGTNFSFIDNKISLMSMYHSTKSATFGVGMQYQNFAVGGMYNTTTSGLSSYANGNFEINLKLNLLK